MLCKYLGSILDTENDIKRRKTLALVAFNSLKHIFESRRATLEVKIRLFNSHIQSIFLYNSELWTLTKSLKNTVDVFQRNTLRKIINIRWPNKIRNEDLYEKCGVKEWSKIVKERRLRWYGHLLRLANHTPAKRALKEARREVKKPKGGQKLTWLKLIDRDLEKVTMVVVNGGGYKPSHEQLAQNRSIWQEVVNRAMSS